MAPVQQIQHYISTKANGMRRETELVIQYNVFLCDLTILLTRQILQRPHRLDNVFLCDLIILLTRQIIQRPHRLDTAFLCDLTILLTRQILQRHHRLDNHWSLSRYTND
jgi:hypothetical protein